MSTGCCLLTINDNMQGTATLVLVLHACIKADKKACVQDWALQH